MAMGATGAEIRRLFLRQGASQLAAGTPIGLVLAFWLAGTLKSALYRVSPRDPVVLGTVLVVLAAVGLLSCLVPARRASRVDPVVALRDE